MPRGANLSSVRQRFLIHLGWMSHSISAIAIRVNRSRVLRSWPLGAMFLAPIFTRWLTGLLSRKCIFRPAMFSPRQTTDGVVYTDGKMLPPARLETTLKGQ